MSIRHVSVLLCLMLALRGFATTIPLELPRPDGQPGNPKKPVKVYILAGQSNMVGMGELGKARPQYASIYFSADPALIPGEMPIGPSAVARLIVTEAQASVFQSAFDPQANYALLKPVTNLPVALGTTAATLPTVEGLHTVVVKALIEVPATGNYTLHAGFGDSTHAVVALDGKEVYRREIGGKAVTAKVTLEAGKRYPVSVTYFKDGSAAFWLEQLDLPARGSLEIVTQQDKKFQYLLGSNNEWTVRNDVYFQEARLVEGGKGCPLSATANSKCLPKCASIGPEVGFGYVMGTFHDEQVLLIKTAQGNRSLGSDFRPPSSGRLSVSNEFEGMEYRLLVKGVRETLSKIDKVVPGYAGQGYEIAGFGWFQGHKDSGSTKEDYEKNLVNLISDLRKEFNTPKMPVVVATVGFHGYRLLSGSWKGVWEAQMAVGDPKQHPELAGTVAAVDTRDFWREIGESPRSQDYHYNRNAETYMLVGEAMGRAMVRLQGGEAELISKSDREARVAAEMAAEAAKTAPTPEQLAAHAQAIQPLILDGALASFMSNPANQPELQAIGKGARPAKAPRALEDALDEAVNYYRAAGITNYNWKPVAGDMKTGTWNYLCFDLPGTRRTSEAKGVVDAKVANEADPEGEDAPAAKPAAKGKKAAAPGKMVFPAGTENWFAADFDAQAAGWKSGAAPFGERSDNLVLPDYLKSRVGKRHPATLTGADVLLLRQRLDLPACKDGYRYRIRVGGSAHNNMGEGYAIYINGKLLAEVREGVTAWRKEGHFPRGALVDATMREAFKGGPVTLAVANYPLGEEAASKVIPPGAPLSVWIEEQKLPPL